MTLPAYLLAVGSVFAGIVCVGPKRNAEENRDVNYLTDLYRRHICRVSMLQAAGTANLHMLSTWCQPMRAGLQEMT